MRTVPTRNERLPRSGPCNGLPESASAASRSRARSTRTKRRRSERDCYDSRMDNELARLKTTLAVALQGDTRVAAAYLFGSVARGDATPLSDIDIAVVLAASVEPQDRGRLQRQLLARLGAELPGRDVDVRFLDELPTAIAGRVVTEGILVLDQQPVERVRAEVRARMLYHDFLPFEQAGTREGLAGLHDKAGG